MGNASWSRIEQLNDNITQASYKFLILDVNKLDGSFKLMGSPDYQVGWGGDKVSNATGILNPPETLALDLGRTVRGAEIRVDGNDKLGHYPKHYTMEFKLDGQSVHKITMNQTGIRGTATVPEDKTFNHIEFVIDEVNVGNSTSKMIEVGVFSIFPSGSDSIRINTTETSSVGVQQPWNNDVIPGRLVEAESMDVTFPAVTDRGVITSTEQLVIDSNQTDSEQATIRANERLSLDNDVPSKDNIIIEIRDSADIHVGMNLTDRGKITTTESHYLIIEDNDILTPNFIEEDEMENIHTVLKKDTRTVYARAKITYTREGIAPGTNVTADSEVVYNSFKDDLLNASTDVVDRMYFLDNKLPLDGTVKLTPGEIAMSTPIVFRLKSKADGKLTQPLIIELNFDHQPLRSLLLVGAAEYDQRPKEFKVITYKGSTIIDTQVVQNNQEFRWEKAVNLPDVTKVRYEITQINKPDEYIKLHSVYGSVAKWYYNDDIVSMNILEEMFPQTTNVNLGNMSQNSVNLTLLNQDGEFSYRNGKSILKGLLNSNKEIQTWYGAEVMGKMEWYPMGTYWSKRWTTTSDTLNASTTAYDRLSLLTEYHNIPVMRNVKMKEAFEIILRDAKVPTSRYKINPIYDTITIPVLYFDMMTHGECLKELTKINMCNVYCDRNDVIQIQPRREITQPQGHYANSDYFTNEVSHDNRLIINDIRISLTTMEEIAEDAELAHPITVLGTVNPGESITQILVYSSVPVEKRPTYRFNHANTTEVVATKFFSYGMLIQITNNGLQPDTVTINDLKGRYMEAMHDIAPVRYTNSQSISDYGLQPFSFNNNLMQSEEIANALGNELLTYQGAERPEMYLQARGDFAVDIGHDVYSEAYDDIDRIALYKQIRARHFWEGYYSAEVDLEFERRGI